MADPKPKQVAIIDDATGIVEMVMGVIPPKGKTVEKALPLPAGKTLVYPTASQTPERGGTYRGGKFYAPEPYDMQKALGLPTADEPRPEVEDAEQGPEVEASDSQDGIEGVTVAGASPVGAPPPLVPIDQEMEAPEEAAIQPGAADPELVDEILAQGPILEPTIEEAPDGDA